jgi:16S rRNA (cytosine967-C5)-methyltransferase
VDAAAHANGMSVVLLSPADVTRLGAFADGWVQPQDAAATAVVADAPIEPGMRVLDLCAAPGTKTTHLAERMDGRGEIVAVDVSRRKLDRVEENCRRMGADLVRTTLADRIGGEMNRPFDLVLVDAPCSNTGVLARRPEARWRYRRADVAALAADQQNLLYLATELTAGGGAVVYSTCSLQPRENGRVVREVLKRQKTFRLADERPLEPDGADEPTRWSDGGYRALLR